MLADMPGVGVWRLETHGYYAAAELPAVADLLSRAGGNVAARLEMEQRQQMVDDPRNQGKQLTALFYVPVLHVEATPAQLLQVLGASGRAAAIGVGSDGGEPPAIEGPPAAVVAAPVAPAAQPTPLDDPETVPNQPDLIQRITTAIGKAADRDRMMTLKANIEAAVLNPHDRTAVEQTWMTKAQEMANAAGPNQGQIVSAQATPAQPTPPAVAAPTPAPPAPAVDRQAVFLAINTWAGFKQLGLSALQAFYKEWSPEVEGDLRKATGDQLQAFKTWLEANK
jgi:hypothetical protein